MTADSVANRTPQTDAVTRWTLHGPVTITTDPQSDATHVTFSDPAAQVQADEAVRLLRELVAEVGSDPITEAAHLVPLRSRLAAWIKARAFLARLDGEQT